MCRHIILLSLTILIAWCSTTPVSEVITETEPYTNITDTIVSEDRFTDPTLDEVPLPDNLDDEIITQQDVSL